MSRAMFYSLLLLVLVVVYIFVDNAITPVDELPAPTREEREAFRAQAKRCKFVRRHED